VNRALPPGDCGNRTVATGWPFRCAGALPGVVGLVLGVAASSGCPGPSAVIAPVAPQLAHVRAGGGNWTCRTTLGPERKKPATAVPGGPESGIC
jgi:hypothetical protein